MTSLPLQSSSPLIVPLTILALSPASQAGPWDLSRSPPALELGLRTPRAQELSSATLTEVTQGGQAARGRSVDQGQGLGHSRGHELKVFTERGWRRARVQVLSSSLRGQEQPRGAEAGCLTPTQPASDARRGPSLPQSLPADRPLVLTGGVRLCHAPRHAARTLSREERRRQ